MTGFHSPPMGFLEKKEAIGDQCVIISFQDVFTGGQGPLS